MLRCDDPDSCVVLSGDHNIYPTRGRLQLLCIAVLLYRILAIQQTQLPDDAVPLCGVLEFTSGTTTTVMEDSIVKRMELKMRSNRISLTSWQRFSSYTEQQKPVSTSYGLKMFHTFAPNTQSHYLLLVNSLGLALLLSE